MFADLKENAAIKADGPTRLFFPNGIELLSLKVQVNSKDGITVEIKVAGEKGVQGTLRTAAASRRAQDDPSPYISSIYPYAVEPGWEGDLAVHGSGFDEGSFVLFDEGAFEPDVVSTNPPKIVVKITKDMTAMAGIRLIEVHSGEGLVSNTANLTVTSVPSPKTESKKCK